MMMMMMMMMMIEIEALHCRAAVCGPIDRVLPLALVTEPEFWPEIWYELKVDRCRLRVQSYWPRSPCEQC